ncbi:MAG: hypothetical protein WDN49_07065 [Acetobacteraceae bacterium]
MIVLRGAMDGLSPSSPMATPIWQNGAPSCCPPQPGRPGGLLDLGGFYGLHPVMTGMHQLYQKGELLPVHAVAGHYRSRSHFEAQDYLEGGTDRRMDSAG